MRAVGENCKSASVLRCLRNDSRQGHSYYRTPIGSHNYVVHQIVSFSMTFSDSYPGFKIFFDGEYLKKRCVLYGVRTKLFGQ